MRVNFFVSVFPRCEIFEILQLWGGWQSKHFSDSVHFHTRYCIQRKHSRTWTHSHWSTWRGTRLFSVDDGDDENTILRWWSYNINVQVVRTQFEMMSPISLFKCCCAHTEWWKSNSRANNYCQSKKVHVLLRHKMQWSNSRSVSTLVFSIPFECFQ